MIACLRSLGLPARYVSGYLRSGEKTVGAEASHERQRARREEPQDVERRQAGAGKQLVEWRIRPYERLVEMGVSEQLRQSAGIGPKRQLVSGVERTVHACL